MSGIAGIVQFDGAPADETRLAQMLASMAHRGPDGRRHHVGGSIAFGHLALHTTREAADESQPFHDSEADLTVVFDGRIDNADECRRLLAAHDRAPRTRSEAELVLRAYEQWGTESAAHLLGDFAFVIWDGRQRRLFAARDIIGVKPLFYRWAKLCLLFASEPQALLCDPTFDRRPNEGMAAEHLAGIVTSKTETLIEDVFRLPPAHTLVNERRSLRLSRYWRPDPDRSIRYRSDRDYEEALSVRFIEAVRCRRTATGQVGLLLSGGLDSSAIAGALGQSRVLRRQARMFSMTFPGRVCDEASFIEAVHQYWGVDGCIVPEMPLDWLSAAETDAGRYLDASTYPNNTMADPLRARIRADGCRVVLSGLGGDEWLRGSPSHYADLARTGRLGALARRVWQDAQGPDFPGWRGAVRMTLWPLLPVGIRGLVKTAIGRDTVPRSVDAGFAARTALRDRLRSIPDGLAFADLTRRESVLEATSGEAVRALEQVDRSAAWFGLEERHPFHDRRLIEFALAVPPDQLWRGGYPKSLMRRAFRDLLPPAVRGRRGRPDYSHLVAQALAAHEAAGFFTHLIVADCGWIDPACVTAARAAVRVAGLTSAAGRRWLWPLWAVCAVEHWARVLFRAPVRAAAPAA
jgi:asparagine synthase (glutamine-hydrolysing)